MFGPIRFDEVSMEILTKTQPIASKKIYEQVDFQVAYEKLFKENQRLQIRFQASLKEIDYLKKRVKKLEGDNTYLQKLLFAQKTERSKKKLQTPIAAIHPSL